MNARIQLPVEEYTTPCPIAVELETSYENVIELMEENNIRHVPVVVDEKAVGIISRRDLVHLEKFNLDTDLRAKDLMQPEPYCVVSSESLGRVAFELSKRKIGSAVVVDDEEKMVGIFTSTDALNALIEIVRGDFEEGFAPSAE